MQVLEPVLIKSDSQVASATVGETEVDFNFAALEGALILQSQFYGFTDNIIADLEADNYFAACLNYNPTFSPADNQAMFADDFTFSFWGGVSVGPTQVGLEFITLMSPLYTHDSILIVRNPALAVFADTGAPTFRSKIWYKRVIFSENELVPFVALRR